MTVQLLHQKGGKFETFILNILGSRTSFGFVEGTANIINKFGSSNKHPHWYDRKCIKKIK